MALAAGSACSGFFVSATCAAGAGFGGVCGIGGMGTGSGIGSTVAAASGAGSGARAMAKVTVMPGEAGGAMEPEPGMPMGTARFHTKPWSSSDKPTLKASLRR